MAETVYLSIYLSGEIGLLTHCSFKVAGRFSVGRKTFTTPPRPRLTTEEIYCVFSELSNRFQSRKTPVTRVGSDSCTAERPRHERETRNAQGQLCGLRHRNNPAGDTFETEEAQSFVLSVKNFI